MLSILVLMRATYNCVISEQDFGNKITFHPVLSNLHLYCFSEKKLQSNVQKGVCGAWSVLDFIPSREAKWWLCFPVHDTQNVTQWLNGDLSQETKFPDHTAGLYHKHLTPLWVFFVVKIPTSIKNAKNGMNPE